MGRYKKKDSKNTKEYIKKMLNDFDDIVYDVDNELDERQLMSGEDINV